MVIMDRPKFRHVLREMAETSSLHGLPKIVTSKQKHMKAIWAILFLATTGYMTFQLTKLFGSYLTWPVKTAVSLKYNPLPFPAVSFCNMNPIKRSRMNLTRPEVLELLKPGKRKKKYANVTEDNYIVVNGTKVPSEVSDGSGAGNSGQEGEIDAADGNNYDYADSGSYDEDEYESDYWYGYDDDYQVEENPFDLAGEDLLNDLMYYDDIDAPRDKWISRIEKFKEAFMNETSAKRRAVGHTIEDMLVSCAFNSRKCFANNFTLFQSSEFGNCFTLESPKYFSRKPGPLNGLWLTLNLEVLEYITNFATGFGVKMVIHQPGTVVFPSVEGLILSPGFETTVALRMVTVRRLGPPYGQCTEGQEFMDAFGFQYTIPACVQLCKHQWVLKMCKCVPSQLNINVNKTKIRSSASDSQLSQCDSSDRDDAVCQMKVEALYIKGQLDCPCSSPCEEEVYEKTISGRPWPNDPFLRQALVPDMCVKKNLTYMKDFCDRYKNNSMFMDLASVHNNFLRAVIYYEDINYEVITESPLYDEFQFLSNIGGTLGLFLGASVLSAVEVIQMSVEYISYLRRRMVHKKVRDQASVSRISVKPFPPDIKKNDVCK